ncbi:hypothetical protein BH23BAC1_BH23BAC1_22160 [soil metagenome]
MKNALLKVLVFSILAFYSFTIVSCNNDDDEPAPVAPVLNIDRTTYTGDIDDQVTVNVTADLDGAFQALRIRKYIGTDQDMSFGTNGVMQVTTGLPYTYTYTLGIDGLTEPIRINFEVEDANGLTDNKDLIIVTEASREQLLTSFNWRWASQEFEGEQTLQECEADNVWSFENNGDVSLDYGALTGSGGGSCDFDGALIHTGWMMTEPMDSLYIYRADATTQAPRDTLMWAITDFDQNNFVADETNIFGVFTWTFEAQAKD